MIWLSCKYSCKIPLHIGHQLQAKPQKKRTKKPTQTVLKKCSSLYVISPNLNLCTKHKIEGFIIKIQTTHILFFTSSPPKGKVCREKWRGNPIWQTLVLFSIGFLSSRSPEDILIPLEWVQNRILYRMEQIRVTGLAFSQNARSKNVTQNALFEAKPTRSLHSL